MSFHQPSVWLLLLLAGLPVGVWWARARRPRPAVVFSSIAIRSSCHHRTSQGTMVVRT